MAPGTAVGQADGEREGGSIQQRERPVRREWFLLAGVLLIAIALRLPGIGWQLPWQFHPDEGHYVWKAVEMIQTGNLNPKYFRNPSLYTYLLFAEFELARLLGEPLGRLAETWTVLQPPSLYTYLGRLTTTLLGVATVATVHALGRELLGRAAGLIGALLLAVSFLHVRDSHYATNDVPATFFLTVSVLFSTRYARTGLRRQLLLAGLFAGLATSAKYNAGLAVAPLLVAWLVVQRHHLFSVRPLVELLGAGLLSVLAYLAGTPFTVLAWPAFRDDFRVQQRFAREGWEGQGPEPVGQLFANTLAQGLGVVCLLLALVGFILLVKRRPLAAALIGAYPVSYLGLMLGVKLFFARFAVPVLPFFCLAAAWGILALAGAVRSPAQRAALLAVLVLAASAQPLWNDLQHRRILSQPDTRVLAYAWLEVNLPTGARIIADDYSVRDRRPRADLPDRDRFDLDVVNSVSEQELAAYRQRGYQYAVTSSFQAQRFSRYDTYDELERRARRLASFAPTPDGRTLPFDIEALYSPFHDLARQARPGPTVTIYALDPG